MSLKLIYSQDFSPREVKQQSFLCGSDLVLVPERQSDSRLSSMQWVHDRETASGTGSGEGVEGRGGGGGEGGGCKWEQFSVYGNCNTQLLPPLLNAINSRFPGVRVDC